jgi:hypothetical protein
MDSEVGTDLYNEGFFQLTYDRALQKWGMKGYRGAVDDKTEWKFCSPNDAMGHVVSILTFLAVEKDKSVTTDTQGLVDGTFSASALLELLANSIQGQGKDVVGTVSQYTERADCSAVPISQQTTPYDGENMVLIP